MNIGGCFLLGGGGLRISHGNHSHLLLRLKMHLAFHSPIWHQDVKETVQQNFFNPVSDNLKILIIQCLRRVVPKAEVLFLPEKSFISERDYRDMLKKVRVHLYIKHCGYPSSPTSTSSVMNSPQNTEENPDDPAPINEGDVQMKDSSA
jgi:hypothetical protein